MNRKEFLIVVWFVALVTLCISFVVGIYIVETNPEKFQMEVNQKAIKER